LILRVFVAALAAALSCLAAGASRADERIDAERFARPDAFASVSLSEDGSRIAVVSQSDSLDVLRVYHTDRLADGPTAEYALGAARTAEWAAWKGERLLFGVGMPERGRANAVSMQTRLFSTDERLQAFTNLVKRPRHVIYTPQFQDQVASFLPADPNGVLVAVDWVDPLHPGLMRLDVRTGEATRVLDRDKNIVGWVVDADGRPRLGVGDAVRNQWRLFSLATDGALTPATDETTDIAALGFDGDPDRLVVSSDHENGVEGLYVYSLSQKRFLSLLFKDARYDVQGAIFSPDGRRVVGARYVADGRRTVYFDPEAKARAERIARLAGSENVFVHDQSRDGRFVVAGVVEQERLAASVWMDLKTGETRPFARFQPALDGAALGRKFAVRFKARDGMDIPAYVTLPPGVASLDQARNLPFVVMPHGGPEARDDIGFDWWAQFVATRGYAVLQPNFRGSTGYGEAFRKAGERAWGAAVYQDVIDGGRWLVQSGLADPRRMCVAGWSFGGYLALAAATDPDPGLFRCAASIAGVADLPDLIESQGRFYGGDLATRRLIGHARRDRARLVTESPARRAAAAAMPVLIVHGDVDLAVPVEQSRTMAARLKAAGKTVDYLELPLADHSLSRQKDRLAMLRALEAFLDAHLQVPAATLAAGP